MAVHRIAPNARAIPTALKRVFQVAVEERSRQLPCSRIRSPNQVNDVGPVAKRIHQEERVPARRRIAEVERVIVGQKPLSTGC